MLQRFLETLGSVREDSVQHLLLIFVCVKYASLPEVNTYQ